ncbi:Nif3-like dinuclear metal center hexameric protein [Halalkalibacterium halodurans]|jgi:dinuclear metal center YbgI/SA1388 family protein|uniref:Nif3-like dinuclear metal center hexameric protein n=1 Tax=Halalkalibacterium halodurans TaxID=86665 RepID=UPI0010679E5B|nr:Nif3-like dinuclear metal center hexameric protein [Halalkalibacterium halodurans]MED3648247.1 Nif3-like dinuclear metal center hexameric protein [Halalkalibacterium halodurans]MED4080613.1 Nif3-like dinuclear metal center hexameric protein [Halalkalibacterium halodurans]MED4083765.1 Nif3-like dinuclear metal center hexameric protein [Halalkalibacterium halodurans]MED4105402.1 Nif3-like dinuclear metal center hexameric protein [Halalkalibacterium halodurans]MED4109392.1 Nif3-like dinuclear 
MKIANGQTVIQLFERWSPKSLAVEGDKNGVLIGTLNKPIQRVLTALDVTESVIDEAIELGAELILAHHPIIFRPLSSIRTDTAYGRIIEKAIKHDLTIYAAHTNLDITKGGVNDLMADALGLKDIEVLAPTTTESLYKLVVFVPHTHTDQVREALGRAGAGHIGNYSYCTFNSKGTGTFKPEEGTNPFIGKQGALEFVEELKIETIVTEGQKNKVVAAMIKSHPYEEPAYDLYPLANEGETLGLGRIGYLHESMTLEEFAKQVKKAFDVPTARVVGSLETQIRKVAVLGGDGNKYMAHALRKGADVIVTGDVYYHVAHDALMDGLNIVDPGHNVEKIMKQGVKEKLEKLLKDKKYDTEVVASSVHTDPFTFI